MRGNRRHQSQHGRANTLRRLLSPRTFLLRHAQVATDSLGRLYRGRLAAIMTAAVIGIALAMPSSLYILLTNLDRLSGNWNGQASLSVFLKQDIADSAASALADRVRDWPEVAEIKLITPNEALEEFRQHSGFAGALEALDENPLPAVLTVMPTPAHTGPEAANALRAKFQALPETELAQLDLQWVQRLTAMLEIAERGILVISVLFALAVLLVVGNTIRLEIQNRRDEIVVTKLIGATNAFVRRPFLYSGFWYGLLGAGIAWGMVQISFALIAGPAEQLASLYQSSFALQTLPGELFLVLLAGGAGLGLLGSWLAVGRHLDAIEPT